MSERRRRGIVVLGAIQVAMAMAAWLDLARRSSGQVAGSKRLWAAVICVNFFGPITYFVLGRRSDPPQQASPL
ncbi:PLDc N-terminal domain-containing protein [Rhodococcus sp. ARC_M12]|uniref:PLDc N-terminal domain-containing protein n=1 Tax=Rhodococcus navarretei TaxID=3128981 RepID=A0ABU9CZ58_9NOCA|nr:MULTISPECIES: PLDc N-terminal domain-containing protein [unclassified Rhodococcus (in: high G+C Gram-positive bacteria)]MCJ0979600.1 PLDc N-terminal domain-containing protein [Rhodococcus sp. ARC_M12]